MKKKLFAGAMIACMAMSMAACGGSGSSAPAGDAAAPAGDPNTLTVYAWDKNFNIPALEAAAEDFKTVNPDFKLEIIEQSGSSDIETAITTAGSAGDYSTLPDIVLFQDHYIQRYVADYPDAFVSAEGVDVNWDDLGAEKLSYSTINGVHYGYPVDNGTAIMAYRTDILEECGYTLDDMTGITWAQFEEIGKEVYAKTGKYLLSMDGEGNDLFYMMLQAEGESQFKDGVPYIAENAKLVQIVELLADMAKNNVLYLANSWSDYTDQTIVGDMVAGVMNGNWIIPTMEQVGENAGKWGITSMPTLAGGEGFAANGGSSLYVTGNCQNVDLAKEFLAYTFGAGSVTDGKSITYDNALTNGGVIGTSLSAAQSDVYAAGVDFFNGQPIYQKIVEMGANVPVVEQNDFHYTCRTKMATALQQIIDGTDVTTALKDAEEQLRFEMGL